MSCSRLRMARWMRSRSKRSTDKRSFIP
jgi:hypothetical protein